MVQDEKVRSFNMFGIFELMHLQHGPGTGVFLYMQLVIDLGFRFFRMCQDFPRPPQGAFVWPTIPCILGLKTRIPNLQPSTQSPTCDYLKNLRCQSAGRSRYTAATLLGGKLLRLSMSERI